MNNKNQPTFAEIEYDTSIAGDAPLRVPKNSEAEKAIQFFRSLVPPPQKIEHKPIDPIRQKFFDMRSLASNRPFARDDSELFYRQAKFMKDFTDDYQSEAKLNMYFPYYQHMGYEQLRTYFTWRTKIRNGEKPKTHLSYIFLYVYELLSNIGVKDPDEALDKLLMLLNEYSESNPPLSKYLPKWIKDHIVYYGFSPGFENFVNENNLQKYYPELYLFDFDNDNIILFWSSISNYDITTSKFYQEGNEKIINDYFRAVLVALEQHFNMQKKSLRDLIIYRISNRVLWQPFKHALFRNQTSIKDSQVNLMGQEAFYHKNNRWTTSHPIYYSNRESIAGYLVKKTESSLRETLKYKYKLKMSPRPFGHNLISSKELDKIIGKAVNDHHKYINRTIVTVDHVNLERIREEALDTQDKLIVDEAESDRCLWQKKGGRCYIEKRSALNGVKANDYFEMQQSFAETTIPNEWDTLKDALNEIELQALKIALTDNTAIKAFANKNGIMLEVLADSINEKAADIIGDSILEVDDSITIYDDYKQNVKDIL